MTFYKKIISSLPGFAGETNTVHPTLATNDLQLPNQAA
jgi:hypothetical protein